MRGLGFIFTLVIVALLASPALAAEKLPPGVVRIKGDGVTGLGYSLGHGRVVTSLHVVRLGQRVKVDDHWADVVARGMEGVPPAGWEDPLPRGTDWAIVLCLNYLLDAEPPKAIGFLPKGTEATYYCPWCGEAEKIRLGSAGADYTQEYTGEPFCSGCSGGPVMAGEVFVGIVTADYEPCSGGSCPVPKPGASLGFLTLWHPEWGGATDATVVIRDLPDS